MFEVQGTRLRLPSAELQHNRIMTYLPNHPVEPGILTEFRAINLGDLGKAALQERQESKYLFQADRMADLLRGLQSWYRILEIDGSRIFRYQSIYYDTPELNFYHQHHRGASPRWKYRQRTYLESGTTYLEIKCKDNHGKTSKVRQQVTDSGKDCSAVSVLGPCSHFPFQPNQLQKVLQTKYSRICLVSETDPERVTLDFNLQFHSRKADRELPALLIIEVKQQRLTHQSAIIHRLREFGLRPTSFSKYCIGNVLLMPGLKHNRFKPVLRSVDSIQKGV